MYLLAENDRLLGEEDLKSIVFFLRELASEIEIDAISISSLPARLSLESPADISDIALCLLPLSRWEASESARRKLATLTKRQQEVLKMIVDGDHAKEIAINLNLSRRTVENHTAAIYRKTESRGRSNLLKVVYSRLY